MFTPFWLALQMLTRIPVPVQPYPTPRDWGHSVVAYPLVGFLIGLLLVFLHWLLADTDPGVQAALLLVVWTLITGGTHVKGLANSADAWSGGHADRQRTLEILRDPRSGPVATMMLTITLIMKFAALSVLAAESALEIFLLAPVMGRAAMVAMLATTPYVSLDAIGAERAAHVPRQGVIWTLLAVVAGTLFLVSWGGVLLLLLLLLGGYLIRRMMMQRLGGVTDDTLGGVCELTEAGVLVVVVLVWG